MATGQTVVWATLFYVFPAMIVRWESIYSWSKVQLTGAITLALLASAFSSPAVGRLIDRGYGPRVLSLGAASGAVVLYGLSWVTLLWQFYLLWAVMGVALAACLYEPCFMLVTRAYGSDAKRSIIAITLIAGFASSISFPAAYFLTLTFGWQSVLWCFSAAAFFIGAPALFIGGNLVEQHLGSQTENQVRHERLRLRDFPLMVRLGVCFSLLAVVHGATLHHLLAILDDRVLSVANAVLVASLIGPMQVAGRLVVTILQNRVTHAFIAQSCFLVIGLSMALLFFSGTGLAVAVLFSILFGGSYGLVSIIRPVIARDILGDERFGIKSGYLAFFYLIGSAVSPYLGSLVWRLGGYDLLIPLLAVLSLTGLVAIRRVVAEAIGG